LNFRPKWQGRGPWIVLAIFVAACLVGTVWWYVVTEPRRAAHEVSEVVPGVLYRSAQPEGESLLELRDRWHFRTVINLRETDADERWQEEEEFCRANGIRFVSIALGQKFTEPELRLFMDTVQDPAAQPVLVHCEVGRNRTGYAIAYYRIAVQHWTFEAAMDEARHFGLPQRSDYYEDALKALAEREAPAATGSPAAATTGR
jgi:protein tyrosine/serine phosphatase